MDRPDDWVEGTFLGVKFEGVMPLAIDLDGASFSLGGGCPDWCTGRAGDQNRHTYLGDGVSRLEYHYHPEPKEDAPTALGPR